MEIFRRIDSASSAADSIILTLAPHGDGAVMAALEWPDRPGLCAGRLAPMPVPEALERAKAAYAQGGFAEIAVKLPSADLWQPEWGELRPEADGLSEEEAYELASATETGRDA